MLTISKLMRFLDALQDETSCEYQAWGENSIFLDIEAGLLAYLMRLFVPYPI